MIILDVKQHSLLDSSHSFHFTVKGDCKIERIILLKTVSYIVNRILAVFNDSKFIK